MLTKRVILASSPGSFGVYQGGNVGLKPGSFGAEVVGNLGLKTR